MNYKYTAQLLNNIIQVLTHFYTNNEKYLLLQIKILIIYKLCRKLYS